MVFPTTICPFFTTGFSIIPPTANLNEVDPKCDPKMDFVPKTARKTKVDYAMSNSLGFGGHNCSLIVGRI